LLRLPDPYLQHQRYGRPRLLARPRLPVRLLLPARLAACRLPTGDPRRTALRAHRLVPHRLRARRRLADLRHRRQAPGHAGVGDRVQPARPRRTRDAHRGGPGARDAVRGHGAEQRPRRADDRLEARAAQRSQPHPHGDGDPVRLHVLLDHPRRGRLQLARHRHVRLPELRGLRLRAHHGTHPHQRSGVRGDQPGDGPALPGHRPEDRMTAARTAEARLAPDPAAAAARGESAAARRWRPLRRDAGFWVGAVVLGVLAFVSVAPGLVAPYGPTALDILSRLKPPSWAHPFGTDEVGRDVFSRVLHGTRLSLGVAVCVAVIGALIGVVVGAVFLAFPTFILAMAVASVAGRGLASLALSLIVVWW